MKSRLQTKEPAESGTLPTRRPALLAALTAACVVAHAAVLGGLPRLRAAPNQEAAQPIAVRLVHVTRAAPETPQSVVALNQQSALDAMPAAGPTSGVSTSHVGWVRTTPAEPRESVSLAQPPVADIAMKHLPTSALDLPPMPRSAPDEQYVEHVHRSGLPIKVRLFIDASGSVTETSLLGAAPGDEDAAEQVVAMFRDTAFSPGRLQGREVASFIDIELVLEPTLPALGRIVRQ